MTLHIVLRTKPDGIVWVADLMASLRFNNTADIEKITYIEERKTACSAWGDYAFTIRGELVRWIREENPNLSNPTDAIESLQTFAGRFHKDILPTLVPPPNGAPGFIVATFFDKSPKAYCGMINSRPFASLIEKNLWAGDDYSPAKIFVDYYYALSGKTVEDALLFGVHAMRLAHRVKASYIGEPNAWVYRSGKFERLTEAELADHIRKSEAIDAAILKGEW